MGGTIYVGIREEDGTIHHLHTWTNAMPWRTASPSFYNKGEQWDQFFEQFLKPDWCTRRLKKMSWRDTYGYVLFDFKDKIIFSGNGYYSPGSWNLLDPNLEDIEQVKEMKNLGWIEQVYNGSLRNEDFENYHKGLPAKDSDGNLRILLEYTRQYDYFIIKYCPVGWTIDHTNDHIGQKAMAARLKKFLAEHQW